MDSIGATRRPHSGSTSVEDHRGGTLPGRLKPGVTMQQAESDIESITANIARTYPDSAHYLHAFVLPMRDQFADTVSRSLIVLLVAVGCVLLVACANIALRGIERSLAQGEPSEAALAVLGGLLADEEAQPVIFSLMAGAFGTFVPGGAIL